MFIRLKTPMTVKDPIGRPVDVPANTPVNYGSERAGGFMRHWFHVHVWCIEHSERRGCVVTHTETLPIKAIPEWL